MTGRPKLTVRGFLAADNREVYVDPFDGNPLEQEAAYRWPELHSAKKSPAPKLFQGGQADVPAFTASGLDPQQLLKLPAGVRHYAAAEPDLERVHGLFEQYANDPYAIVPHEGLKQAAQRVEKWMARPDEPADTRTPEQVAADNDALYNEIYGQSAA